jgi:hypothetical protein
MRKTLLVHKVPVSLYLSFSMALFCYFLSTGQALAASTPAYTTTLIAGPYIIDVSLSQNPPFTDQPFEVTVSAHGSNQALSGLLIAEPGLGTDAVRLQTPLSPLAGVTGKSGGWLHLPVRGAWQLVINVNGPQGQGSASMDTTVGAPGAIPPWLAWAIAATPLILIVWWVHRQRRYRRTLLAEKEVEGSIPL